MESARKYVTYDGQFRMHHAGHLESPIFAYETWGKLNKARDNAVLIFTGLSPSAHVTSSVEDPTPGWWEDMVGIEHPIDTERYFVICVNSLGSCFGTTGPASDNPATGERYGLDFPLLTLEDVAESAWYVVQQLGIDGVRVRPDGLKQPVGFFKFIDLPLMTKLFGAVNSNEASTIYLDRILPEYFLNYFFHY